MTALFCRIAAMNEKGRDNVLTNCESINVYNEQVHEVPVLIVLVPEKWR